MLKEFKESLIYLHLCYYMFYICYQGSALSFISSILKLSRHQQSVAYNQYNNLYIYIENKQENNVSDTGVLHSDRSNFTREERSAMWLWRLI